MRTIVALILLVIIVSLGIFEQIYIGNVFEELKTRTEELMELIENEEHDAAINKLKDTKEWWNKKSKIMDTIVPHLTLKDIGVQLSFVEGYMESNDSDQSMASCYVILGLCESTPHMLGFHFEHIF